MPPLGVLIVAAIAFAAITVAALQASDRLAAVGDKNGSNAWTLVAILTALVAIAAIAAIAIPAAMKIAQ